MEPIDKFNEWARTDHAWIHKTGKNYGEVLTRSEFAKMRAWIEANPRRGNKKNYRRFMVNWMNRCQQILIKAVYDNAAVERANEDAKRRSRGRSDFEQIGGDTRNGEM